MKAVVMLFAFLFMSRVFAAMSYPIPETVQTTQDYECVQYTVNEVHQDGTTTDNPVMSGINTVHQTVQGFNISAGAAFKDDKILTNAQMGSISGMAGDPETLLLKKENSSGSVYFTIYLFDKTKINAKGVPTKGAVNGLIVLAGCNETP